MKTLLRMSKEQPHWFICLISIIVVSLYFGLIASDRYDSYSSLVISLPRISSGQGDFSSNLSGSSTRELSTSMLLESYIQSPDLVNYVIKHSDFLQHYSQHGDFFSRLHSEHEPIEKLVRYFNRRVSLQTDEYTGIIDFNVQAFSAKEANSLANLILQRGERHLNEVVQNIAKQQVNFLQKQADLLQQQYQNAQNALLNFENQHNVASPPQSLTSFNHIIAQLQAQLATLRAQQAAMASYQSTSSPQMITLSSQIRAIEQQITEQQHKLTASSGNTLNAVSSEYQALQLKSQFALQAYSGILTALDNAQIMSASQSVHLSYIQPPTLPQYPELPDRLYDITVFAIVAIFVTLIVNMLILIVKDHKN